jgi:C4-dicarboxylate-specific signal transduction histidine kinase
MLTDKPTRRLPLRDLLTDAEKRSRDLIEQLTSSWLAQAGDLRDLSRPLRKRSHYPTFLALQNAIQKMVQNNEQTDAMITVLMQQLEEINEHARRERLNRR